MEQSGVFNLASKRIFLLGYMGAGKTTLGKVLAKRLGLFFFDLDAYIENRYCKSVSDLFAERGEDAFRQIEQRMLHEIGEFENVLISTGGGTPCFFDNMRYMKEQGTTIFLCVSVDELLSRLKLVKRTRPLLKEKNAEELRAFIKEGLVRRISYYEQAEVIIDAELMYTKEDVERLSEKVITLLPQTEDMNVKENK